MKADGDLKEALELLLITSHVLEGYLHEVDVERYEALLKKYGLDYRDLPERYKK